MKRSAADSIESPPSPVRLLLHAMDGTIPFLTPTLLRKYVPPSDHLWIGIAVRDSCVVPVYPDVNKINNKKKAVDASKPCGYAFTGKVSDEILRDYNRVTVPSFDLCQDVLENNKRNERKVTSTDQQVMVWTPHGRHGLTSKAYLESSQVLGSHATVPLYDMSLDDESPKRYQTAVRRSAAWLEEFVESQPSQPVWAPAILNGNSNADSIDPLEHIRLIRDKLSGIAFIGWHHIESRTERNDRLQTALKGFENGPGMLVILTTRSTQQIIDAARAGINMIGTSLPTLWAKGKKAFVCDVKGWNTPSSKRSRTEEEDSKVDEDGCLDFHDTCWKRDRRPLVQGCKCLACASDMYSRAYIHHLVLAKELLAEILLFGHNLHHLLIFFQELSNSNKAKLCDFVEAQLG